MAERTALARKVLARLVLLVAAGLVLVWCGADPADFGASSGFDTFRRHVLYRGAFFVSLPATPFAMAVLPSGSGSFIGDPRTAAAMLAPFFWYGVWFVWRRLVRQTVMRGKADAEDMSRRTFLATATFLPPVAGAGVAANAVCRAPQGIRVARYKLQVCDLPAELHGLRLVQLSDTHYGSMMALSYLERVVARANALEPDVMLLTGDYVLGDARNIGPGVRLFSALTPRIGTLAVLGNHDHWTDAALCREVFAEVGVPLVDHGRRFVTASRRMVDDVPASGLCIGGVGDLWTDRIEFDKAVAGAGNDMPRLILAHNPDTAEKVPASMRVDLMFSGHTHGGQVRVPFAGTPVVPSRYGSKYAGGLARGPQCRVLVSRGIGMAMMPVRFRVPPEIVLVELQSLARMIEEKGSRGRAGRRVNPNTDEASGPSAHSRTE